ncbi:MAG: glycerophosphodiester phosphodiesterase, partial [Clostridiales bacterium]
AARPHFIACEQQMLRSPPVRFCKAAGAAVVVWTARTLEETRRAASADAVIFEAHRPRNQRRA